MSHRYDAIIVGAGPSGSAAGIALARAGLSVLILDKARFPRDKPCGGLLAPRSTATLRTLLGEVALDKLTRVRSRGCRLFYHGSLIAAVDEEPEFVSVARSALDAALLEAAAAAGCEVREGVQVVGVVRPDNAVLLAAGEPLTGRFLIGADGARSVMAAQPAEQGRARRRGMGFGLMSEIPVAEAQAERRESFARTTHIFFGSVPWGYGWIIPHGDLLNVGVGGILRQSAGYQEALRELLRGYFLPGTAERANLRGHVLPYGRFQRAPGRGNLLLVGDAAGLVDPITGEGIANALESGLLAGRAIQEAVAAGHAAEAGKIYNGLLRTSIIKPLHQAAMARWLLYPRPCLPLAMRTLRKHPRLARLFCQVLAGQISYGQYFARMLRPA